MNMYNWNSPPTINGQTQKGHPTELMRNGKDTLVFYFGNSWGVRGGGGGGGWEGRGQGRNTDPPLSKINNLACPPPPHHEKLCCIIISLCYSVLIPTFLYRCLLEEFISYKQLT